MAPSAFFLSLISEQNDYQREQAAAAQEVALRLGVTLEVDYAGGDAIKQSSTLMQAISSGRFQGVILQPVGAAMERAAEMAVTARCGWAVLNRQPTYLSALRLKASAPVFCIAADQVEVGRIQGKQVAALLPQGGTALVIQGPGSSEAAQQRTAGLQATTPSNVTLRLMRADWTESSAHDAVKSWLRLSRGQTDMVVAQNDAMAIGARQALLEARGTTGLGSSTKLPIIGVDGLASGGQRWVQEGVLTATILIPANAGEALATMVEYLGSGGQPADTQMNLPRPIPAVDTLRAVA